MTVAEVSIAAPEQRVVYVYGVARVAGKQETAPPRLAGIVPDAPVVPLVRGNLIAFVSTVPAAQFGPDEFRAALGDAQWLKERILAHEKVLEELRSGYDVVPFRFGTIYLDCAKAAAALARHGPELCRALDRIRNASEWGLKLYCDTDTLCRQIEVESDSMRRLRRRLGQASPGARFFLQKNYVRAVDDEAAAAITSRLERIQQHLDSYARESIGIEVQSAAVHGRAAQMVMNAAYLVPRASLQPFQDTIAGWQEEFAAQGFDYELTGPWPPYHFAALRQEGIADAATSDQ